MRAEIRHFFETASEKERRQAKAEWNQITNTTLSEKANAARRQELGVQDDVDSTN
uniref:Uncharacterized protein n=1 Tax=viral metagenome TaxID=1070528 RepID=A0A6M3LIH9_9ZZZZ